MDVESLQNGGRRRGSCLDAFLLGSIIFLFVAVAAVISGGVLVVMKLRAEVRPAPLALEMTGGAPSPAFKMQNYAYLKASASELKNSTMHWAKVHYGTGSSIGSNFQFNPEQQLLTPKQAGIYFMYIELKLTCTYRCKAGHLTIRVGNKLSCEVALEEVTDQTPVKSKCWAVSQVDGQGLLTQMSVSNDGLTHWTLDLNSSGFGMFLVG